MSGQSSYIQVIGEPNLKVFLNNEFKAKTTADIGGCIIENVSAGSNLIKIVKEGYLPFEETITIKQKEVFSYKVKPFVKNTVFISEKGNSGETDKKAIIETGKLIVQSVPINIKITIPSIEGVNNLSKTKDEWIVDKIPSGKCEIKFMFNDKIINRTVEIKKDQTTSVFVNMISGEVKTNNSEEDRIKGEKAFANYVHFKYYDIGLSFDEAKKKYPEYFKKSSSYKYKDQPKFDRIYYSNNLYVYGKNDKIVGYLGYVQGKTSDDSNFTIGNKAITELIDNLTSVFYFSPTITTSNSSVSQEKFNTTAYVWEKNGKTISISYIKTSSNNGYSTQISLMQFDN
jgi:hypothetical protein